MFQLHQGVDNGILNNVSYYLTSGTDCQPLESTAASTVLFIFSELVTTVNIFMYYSE